MMVARHGMSGMCRPEARPVGYGMIGQRTWGYCLERCTKRGATDHTVPYGTGHAYPVPGISCLATLVSSLRDQKSEPKPPMTPTLAPLRLLQGEGLWRQRATG